MATIYRPEIESFLKRFFGEGNNFHFEWATREDGGLNNWLQFLSLEEPHPVVLPRNVGKAITWYGIAFSNQQLRNLTSEIKAFIGSSYSDFNGNPVSLDLTDPVEKAIHNLSQLPVLKFTGNYNEIWAKLELMRKVWLLKPPIVRVTVRPIGRVLRDFKLAIQAQNCSAAEEHLSYLRDHCLLDEINSTFLQVQFLAGFGFWTRIVNLPNFPDLLQARRPLNVTQVLLKAVYRVYMCSYETTNDLDGAKRQFKEKVAPNYQTLFSNFSGVSALVEPDAIKLLMFYSINSNPIRFEIRDQLLTRELPDCDMQYLCKIASLVPDLVHNVNSKTAQEALIEGDFEKAYHLAQEVLDSVQKAKLLMECAYQMQTLVTEKAAYNAVTHLSPQEKDSLLAFRKYKEFWNELSGGKDEEQIYSEDWLAWIRKLNNPESGFYKHALKIAERGANEWQIKDFLQNVAIDDLILELQATRTPEREQELYNSLPFMLDFFKRDLEWPRPTWNILYECILLLLNLSSQGSESDLTIYTEMVETLLSLGVTTSSYQEIIEYTLDLWDKYSSPVRLDWVLDIVDLLIIYPCPDVVKRLDLFYRIGNGIGLFARRVKPHQWDLIANFAEDLGQIDFFETLIESLGLNQKITTELPENILSNKTIAIYTLTESVAKRSKEILEKTYSKLTVTTSSDKVGNDRLKSMAKNADIFVAVANSAKHAATEFISDHRGTLPLLWAKGKGTASILNVLTEYISV